MVEVTGRVAEGSLPESTTHVEPDGVVPVLDAAESIERLGIDPEFYATTLRSFIDRLPDRIDAIRAALQTGDHGRAARAAHALKGIAAMIGAQSLASACATIEARDPDQADEVAALIGELDAVAAATVRAASDLV